MKDNQQTAIEFAQSLVETMRAEGYVLNADDMFALKTTHGVPLIAIIGFAMEKGISHFPWYGYARRMWQSGASRDGIVADIREACSFNRWPEPIEEVYSHLRNLWPDLGKEASA